MSFDKLHHIVYSFAAVVLAASFVPIGWAVVFGVLIGVVKELYWDGLMRRGTPDWGDFMADLAGVVAACCVLGSWL